MYVWSCYSYLYSYIRFKIIRFLKFYIYICRNMYQQIIELLNVL